MERIYSVAEAAEYLGLTLSTMRGYVAKRRIVPDVTLSREHGFVRATLDAFKARTRRACRHARLLDHAAIVARYEAGEKAREIASDVGCSTEHVYYVLRQQRGEAA